jgi:hypothetical protein
MILKQKCLATGVLMACLILSGCNTLYYVMDTNSDTVYEYQNDFFVSRIDSSVELHYEMWSQNASIWLSALNNTEKMLFVIVDSTFIKYNGKRYGFDHLYDWDDYSKQLSRIPNVDDYDLNHVLPILPGRWKGMMAEPLDMSVRDWELLDPTATFTKEDSPWKITVQVCFFRQGNAYSPLCQHDEIWVESFSPVDAGILRSLQRDDKYQKADKFYITNAMGMSSY